MNKTLVQSFREDIPVFQEKIRAFEAGEIDKKAYKGFSGGFGSYAQRSNGNMLRLRLAGGCVSMEQLKFVADMVDTYHIDRLKMTTCQTIQLHNLSADATVAIMEQALEYGIVTRGGGGDFPRNVMVSPLSGVDKEEIFDVRPWANAMADYLLSRVKTVHMPRKLKVAFSSSAANSTHATFRDLGFVAQADGTFAVYCAGGLGPNPKIGVCVAQSALAEDVLHYADAMIRVFTTYGNYENRAKARTRYLQESLGVDGLKEAFQKALEESFAAENLKVFPEPIVCEKTGTGNLIHPRAVAQKQAGLYAVSYHPIGANLAPQKPKELYNALKDIPCAELRIGPDGTLYIINLTAEEAESILKITADGAKTLFETSVSCIGATVCQQGVRDSQGLLAAMVEAVSKENFGDGVLPKVHISGCPSSCGTHQIGSMGFVGGVKMIDKVAHPAFTLMIGGEDAQSAEQFGTIVGAMLEKDIPSFMVELGTAIQQANSTYAQWMPTHKEEFEAIAEKFLVK